MRALIWLMKLDARLALRHRLVAVALVVAVVFGLIVRLLVPESIEHEVPDLAAGVELPTPTVLDPGATKIALDDQMLLLLFALDLCLLGLMFGAVMVLEDRRTGAILVHRVTPIGPLRYVTSKLAVNVGLSLLAYAILVGLAAPNLLARFDLLGLVLLLCAGMTLLGIGLAPLSRGIAQFFFPLIAIGLITALPMFQIWSPARALDWTWWLPTWHVLFGGEAVAFGDGRPAAAALAHDAWIYGLVFLLATALLALLTVHHRLFREAWAGDAASVGPSRQGKAH
jgi:hypothetical protein